MIKECVDVRLVIEAAKQQYVEQLLQSEGLSNYVHKYSPIKDGYEYQGLLD